jgi:hypothetical protein
VISEELIQNDERNEMATFWGKVKFKPFSLNEPWYKCMFHHRDKHFC